MAERRWETDVGNVERETTLKDLSSQEPDRIKFYISEMKGDNGTREITFLHLKCKAIDTD